MVVYHPARKTFGELARKWDRHIAHDFAERTGIVSGKLKWFLRAGAMAVSPLIEVPRIVRSDRVSGWRERGMAFACLCAIRIYRSKAMLGMFFTKAEKAESSWRRRS
jgi:hypothetical protein